MAKNSRLVVSETFRVSKNKTKNKNKNKITNGGRMSRDVLGSALLVTQPSARGVIQHRGKPRITAKNGCDVIVSNVEPFVQIDTQALGAFAFGNNAVIPDFLAAASWLGRVSSNYAKYRWIDLEFIYIPFVPTSQVGRVAFSFTYDATDATPSTAQGVEVADNSVITPIWGGAEGGLSLHGPTVPGTVAAKPDMARVDKLYYPVKTFANFAALPVSERNMYCPVYMLSYAAGGATAVTAAGTIYIKYTVELTDPILAANNA